MASYELLRERLDRERPDLDLDLLDRTFAFAEKAHRGQKRYSGEPYIEHPIAVANILLDLNPDVVSLQAALLHDVTEDTEYKLPAVKKEFGPEVARLVSGLEKLSIVKVPGATKKHETWNKLFLSMAEDIRIVFIKLSDRLHNLRTLQYVPQEKQARIAEESLMIHAAIASRLGIYQFKSEIEDLCFRYLDPQKYEELSKEFERYKKKAQPVISQAKKELQKLLQESQIPFEKIEGRFKHLYSIYQKMQKKEAEALANIYDLFALRIILPDETPHLYSVLGLLHGHYLPLQDRFKDYIAVPKPNGYRSLHTTVLGLGGEDNEQPMEIQIRTLAMHQEAELGVASHHLYKAGERLTQKEAKMRREAERILSTIHEFLNQYPDKKVDLLEWTERYQQMSLERRKEIENWLLEWGMPQEDLISLRRARSRGPLQFQGQLDQQRAWLKGLAGSSLAQMDLDLYPNQIFVLTPHRDVLELPKGATPLDFAYNIHSELGHHAVFAKVNGRIVPLEYELQNGDIVEIGSRSNAVPRRYWLSFVKTNSAKSKIKNWLNRQERERFIKIGRDLLNTQLNAIGKPPLDERLSLLKDYGAENRDLSAREELLETIGNGALSPVLVVKSLFPEEETRVEEKAKKVPSGVPNEMMSPRSDEVLITGEENLPVQLSSCCRPRPPEPIIGFVTRGHAIRIHRQSCSELSGLDGIRFVSAHWKGSNNTSKSSS